MDAHRRNDSLQTDSLSPRITTVEQLEALYGLPDEMATVKQTSHVTPQYRALIEASPVRAAGDLRAGGPRLLAARRPARLRARRGRANALLPDRRGNNRVDSLRNIVRDPRVALLFLIPGTGTTLRLNGRAHITTAPTLLASFAVEGKPPRSVIAIAVEAVYFQCARAIVRSALWDARSHVAPSDVPSPGEILAELSHRRVGGAEYDRSWPERASRTLW